MTICSRDAVFRPTYRRFEGHDSRPARPPRVEWLGSVFRRSSDNDIQSSEWGCRRRQKCQNMHSPIPPPHQRKGRYCARASRFRARPVVRPRQSIVGARASSLPTRMQPSTREDGTFGPLCVDTGITVFASHASYSLRSSACVLICHSVDRPFAVLHETGSYLLSVAVQVRTPLSALRLPQLAADRNCEDENSHGHRQPQESSGHFQVLLAL